MNDKLTKALNMQVFTCDFVPIFSSVYALYPMMFKLKMHGAQGSEPRTFFSYLHPFLIRLHSNSFLRNSDRCRECTAIDDLVI